MKKSIYCISALLFPMLSQASIISITEDSLVISSRDISQGSVVIGETSFAKFKTIDAELNVAKGFMVSAYPQPDFQGSPMTYSAGKHYSVDMASIKTTKEDKPSIEEEDPIIGEPCLSSYSANTQARTFKILLTKENPSGVTIKLTAKNIAEFGSKWDPIQVRWIPITHPFVFSQDSIPQLWMANLKKSAYSYNGQSTQTGEILRVGYGETFEFKMDVEPNRGNQFSMRLTEDNMLGQLGDEQIEITEFQAFCR